MHESQATYRRLWESILTYDQVSPYWEILVPWVEVNAGERDWLSSVASRPGSPIPHLDLEEPWRLYALGRVNQELLVRFQRGRADGTDWPGPPLSLDEYVAFAESLGLVVGERKIGRASCRERV